jgi:hypothetical protein
VLLIAASAQQVFSQRMQDWEGQPVVSIGQEPEVAEELRIAAADFDELAVQEPGQPYSSERIRETVERLYATGRSPTFASTQRRNPAAWPSPFSQVSDTSSARCA